MRSVTVAALLKDLDRLVTSHFPVVQVTGEIGTLQTPSSGHAYFQLRDDDAVLNCVMWRTHWNGLAVRPKRGDRVRCRGKLGVYAAHGKIQLYVNSVEPLGDGALARELAQRRARLAQDGLLDPRRKRSLPKAPAVVGIATSPTGAALQDFLRTSLERWPAAKILLAGCTVQGALAPPSVIQAVELLIEDGRSEVIVVTRGGGSKEDLMAFQDEQLARFLAHSPIPVVTAVGHEIDTTLVDLVADRVASTPTAAATAVLPDRRAASQRVDELSSALEFSMNRSLQGRRQGLMALRARLRHPGERLRLLSERRRQGEERLMRAMKTRLVEHAGRLEQLQGRLKALSPFGVLDRGYAIVSGPDGIVSRADQVQTGMSLSVRVADGAFPVAVSGDDSLV